ncbi:MAG TPA: hypothetical protein VH308_00935 [Terracidiphilus sp.]|nr:hypothetical protein [Terracidiphilus sp.]
MSLSRRRFVADASFVGLLTALMPELAASQDAVQPAATDDTPHDSYDFWNGFFDSVNPMSQNYGQKSATRGPADQLPDPAVETQYLHYHSDNKRLRYATDIQKEELLDHDGDVAVNISLSQFRPATGTSENNIRASQLRIDTTQIHPFMNIVAPLAWTAIASVEPNKAGKVSLEQLGFRTPQATQGTSKILLTQGTGKLAVNVSKAATTSVFVKALNIIMQGAKIAAPLVTLPAISVPALSAFTQALSYWEDRTKFIMAGNLTPAVATQQAYTDPEREARYIGLISGDYLMLPQRHTDDLAKELPNLDLIQGYLVRKDADPSLPLETRAQNAVPGITYASMRVSVEPITGNSASKPEPTSDSGSDSGDDSSSPSGKGGAKGGGKASGSGPKKGATGKTK